MTLLEAYALQQVGERLSQLIDEGSEPRALPVPPGGPRIDALIEVASYRFAIEYKAMSGAAAVSTAAHQIRAYVRQLKGNVIPLIAVPYMGESGQRVCEEAGVSWLDLSGNARIKAPGLRIWIEGHPNKFKERGRPSNVFAPKSARVARWLLAHPREATTQRELAKSVGLDEGQMSRIISRLFEAELVVRDSDGMIRLRDRASLLDEWCEAYQFSKHQIIKGHIAARTGEELMGRLAQTLEKYVQSYAMTGLGAAWQLTHFAGFKLNTVYLEKHPERALLDALTFRPEERGANTWLVLPADAGVFQGAKKIDGIRCVHPVQAYMDLKGLPERAEEAAQHLREAILKGAFDAE